MLIKRPNNKNRKEWKKKREIHPYKGQRWGLYRPANSIRGRVCGVCMLGWGLVCGIVLQERCGSEARYWSLLLSWNLWTWKNSWDMTIWPEIRFIRDYSRSLQCAFNNHNNNHHHKIIHEAHSFSKENHTSLSVYLAKPCSAHTASRGKKTTLKGKSYMSRHS